MKANGQGFNPLFEKNYVGQFFHPFFGHFSQKKTFFGGLGGGHLGTLLPKISPRAWSFRCQKNFPWHALLWICHGKNRSHPPKNALYHTVQMVLVDPCDKLIICFLWLLKGGKHNYWWHMASIIMFTTHRKQIISLLQCYITFKACNNNFCEPNFLRECCNILLG